MGKVILFKKMELKKKLGNTIKMYLLDKLSTNGRMVTGIWGTGLTTKKMAKVYYIYIMMDNNLNLVNGKKVLN